MAVASHTLHGAIDQSAGAEAHGGRRFPHPEHARDVLAPAITLIPADRSTFRDRGLHVTGIHR
ncbi:hypothetical protein GCM10009838_82810 [Catenulispora subtropica]|uniref:Uncharacterized protein n=1 Tax=Catenulispora subtropica TaxID=450798 RepID=A0ABN2TB72_9ACTN